jgi:dienelactone hydrolase
VSPVGALEGWVEGSHTAGGRTHPTFRRGTGPGVVVIHEVPGITPRVAAFADDVVAAGFTVVMPSLFGTPGREPSRGYMIGSLVRGCVSSEFHNLALQRTSPATEWCRSLARDLHAELGGPGVGAVGMCFTGGFALAMMCDEQVVAPVLSQPSLPFAIGRRRAADLNLSPADRATVIRRAADGCEVLGLRYRGDRAVGTRFATLREVLGDRFLAVELEGSLHSVLTEHRDEGAVDRVLAFFREKLLRP